MPRKTHEPAGRTAIPAPILGLLGVLILVLAYRVLAPRPAHAHEHPTPRAHVSAATVTPSDRYAQHPDIAEVYTMAAQIPHVLDGIYCHCDCHEHSGHYSLLTCFESDHGAGCDICLGAAALAYKLHQEGAGLDQIRAQVDAAYSR